MRKRVEGKRRRTKSGLAEVELDLSQPAIAQRKLPYSRSSLFVAFERVIQDQSRWLTLWSIDRARHQESAGHKSNSAHRHLLSKTP